MTLDELRREMPGVGLAVYAIDPSGPVTFEVYPPDGEVYSFTAATEAEAIAKAFPVGEPLAPEPARAPEIINPFE